MSNRKCHWYSANILQWIEIVNHFLIRMRRFSRVRPGWHQLPRFESYNQERTGSKNRNG